jgi:phosphoribosylamine--glycine ligase
MVTPDGPKVLEYNCRLGDPETQVILPRMRSDLVLLLQAAVNKDIGRVKVEWEKNAATCVVLASQGYPGTSRTGDKITGLDAVKTMPDAHVFHAATKRNGGDFVTAGGRVLGVVGMGDKLSASIRKAYEAVGQISFDGMHCRKDIGVAALKNASQHE